MSSLTDVGICNQALGWLGGNLIISLDDPSKEAALCKANYANLRDALLEEIDWSFTMFRARPAAKSAPPEWGYLREFPLPAEMMRVVYCGRSDRKEEDDPISDWRLERNSVLCDEDVIFVRGIALIVDPTKFSNMFGHALAARLALDICLPLTHSKSLFDAMRQLYAVKIAGASSSDARQGRSQVIRAQGMQTA